MHTPIYLIFLLLILIILSIFHLLWLLERFYHSSWSVLINMCDWFSTILYYANLSANSCQTNDVITQCYNSCWHQWFWLTQSLYNNIKWFWIVTIGSNCMEKDVKNIVQDYVFLAYLAKHLFLSDSIQYLLQKNKVSFFQMQISLLTKYSSRSKRKKLRKYSVEKPRL